MQGEEQLLDVLIVGAGLSGIGAAHHLQRHCPNKRFAIIEARDAIGGTWDLFRYPGIRSDSDMYTLGYSFKPWCNAKAFADGPSILSYIAEAANENGIREKIRFGQKMISAAWSSNEACWTVEIEHAASRARTHLRARFLYMCSGYYRYDQAYRPSFAGEERYQGTIIHPQFWPEGLDYAGKRVVVIGSGATAVTLVPEMAKSAAHVTMLQRSPTYVVSSPAEDRLAQGLNRYLPERLAYRITRWKNIFKGVFYYWLLRNFPAMTKRRMVAMAGNALDKNYDIKTHFTPSYDPWDQRVCVAPDGDLFRAIRSGQASVVTDNIECFTTTGLRLKSGQELQADIVVIATGLKVQLLGGSSLTVDGKPFDMREAITYKGVMLSDLPNVAMVLWYTNASWTLKADLTSTYVVRLLRYMDRHRKTMAVPRRERGIVSQAFFDFTSGYIQRAQDELPRQGSRRPWRAYQNYLKDLFTIRFCRIDDGVMRFDDKKEMP